MDSARATCSMDVRLDAIGAPGSAAWNSSSDSTGERILGDCTLAVFVRLRIAFPSVRH